MSYGIHFGFGEIKDGEAPRRYIFSMLAQSGCFAHGTFSIALCILSELH